MRWWLAVCGSALLAAHAVPAAAESCEDRFFSDRPGATNGHWTVGEGCFQIEGSGQVERGPDRTRVSFPTVMRLGAHERIELRLANAFVDVDVPDDGSVDASSTPLGIEAKIMAHELKDAVPGTGMIAGFSAPISSDVAGDLAPQVSWLFDWQFVPDVYLSINAGLAAPVVEGEAVRYPQLATAGVLWWNPPVPGGWLGTFVDAAGGVGLRRGQEWEQLVGAGLAFLPADNAQIDVLGQVAVTGDEHPVTAALGFSWRL